MGASLGAGIERDRLGDIVVQGEKGAQIMTTPEMATFLSGAGAYTRPLFGST